MDTEYVDNTLGGHERAVCKFCGRAFDNKDHRALYVEIVKHINRKHWNVLARLLIEGFVRIEE